MGLFTKYKGLEDEKNVQYKNIPFNEDNSFNSQPFIQTAPQGGDSGDSKVVSSIARGIDRSVTDGIRLSKFMTTPSGIEFILKQELLSRTSVQTETSGKLNNGIYNPLSTLAQAGVSFAGIHYPAFQDQLSSDVSAPRLGYGPTAYKLNQSDQNEYPTNRLAYLHYFTIENDLPESTDTLFRYDGGPGSILGIGATDIKFSTQPDGVTPVRTMGPSFTFPEGAPKNPKQYQAQYDSSRKTLYEEGEDLEFNLSDHYNMGDPGQTSYLNGVRREKSLSMPLDKVNARFIYSSDQEPQEEDPNYRDLIRFKIGILDVNKDTTNYIHFRAIIDSFGDSYNSDWSAQTYMGRGEKLYKYNSFDRSINISFTVAAQSRGEMAGIYQKLNHLASSVTPQYTDYGYMTGNIAKLTVGNYVNEQHGKIDSISYEIPEESPWLIDGEEKYKKQQLHDLSTVVNELPFIIKVQMKFTPIHNFRPELTTNVLDGKFGDQRYITIPIKPKTKGKLSNEPDTPSEMTVNGKPLPKPQGTLKPLFTTKPPIVISNPNNPTNLGGNTSAITNNGMVPGLKPDNSVLNPFSTQFNKSEKPQSVVINKSMMSIDNNSNDFFSPAKSSGRKKKSSSWKNLFRFNRNASTYSA
jgi:hypothetical protein